MKKNRRKRENGDFMSTNGEIIRIFENEYKKHSFERILPLGAIRAAVLMPLTEEDGKIRLLFEVRSKNINQGGEICFPGGRIEENESPQEAAVRETREELLIKEENIRIIAPMYKMLGPAGADIFSYLGFIENYSGTFSGSEAAGVFSISVKELLSIEPKTSEVLFVQTPQPGFCYELIPNGRDYPWADIRRKYYFYETRHGIIWGMTGELLHGFLESIRGKGLDSCL